MCVCVCVCVYRHYFEHTHTHIYMYVTYIRANIGSIRTNLDPFTDYKDRDLNSALEKVHMRDWVPKFSKVLGTVGFCSRYANALILENLFIP